MVASCPMCSGPLQDAQPVEVCAGCAACVSRTGAFVMSSTAEFAAVPPFAPIAPGSRASGPAACTWCGKPQAEVKKLLSGGGAHICNECIALCSDILHAELGSDWR